MDEGNQTIRNLDGMPTEIQDDPASLSLHPVCKQCYFSIELSAKLQHSNRLDQPAKGRSRSISQRTLPDRDNAETRMRGEQVMNIS
jgi:hypothetical protein